VLWAVHRRLIPVPNATVKTDILLVAELFASPLILLNLMCAVALVFGLLLMDLYLIVVSQHVLNMIVLLSFLVFHVRLMIWISLPVIALPQIQSVTLLDQIRFRDDVEDEILAVRGDVSGGTVCQNLGAHLMWSLWGSEMREKAWGKSLVNLEKEGDKR
jgi:hypothetical protein